MSNQLGVAMKNSIISLKKRNSSNREIAQMLGVYRGTVNKYIKDHYQNQNQPKVPTGFSGPPSLCQRYHSTIFKWLDEKGLSAQRIYQDLVSDYDFTGSYDSVKRYVRKLSAKTAVPFRRMETLPEENWCQLT